MRRLASSPLEGRTFRRSSSRRAAWSFARVVGVFGWRPPGVLGFCGAWTQISHLRANHGVAWNQPTLSNTVCLCVRVEICRFKKDTRFEATPLASKGHQKEKKQQKYNGGSPIVTHPVVLRLLQVSSPIEFVCWRHVHRGVTTRKKKLTKMQPFLWVVLTRNAGGKSQLCASHANMSCVYDPIMVWERQHDEGLFQATGTHDEFSAAFLRRQQACM